jgi:hypothetical protein
LNAQPSELVPAQFIAQGAVSPHNATVQGHVTDPATGLSGAVVTSTGFSGGWSLGPFSKHGGGFLSPNTQYTLEVQLASGADAHMITVRTLPFP